MKDLRDQIDSDRATTNRHGPFKSPIFDLSSKKNSQNPTSEPRMALLSSNRFF